MTGFTFGPTDRVLMVGPAGSGKSTAARALTYGYRNLLVIDAKHEESVPRSIVVYTPAEFRRVFPQRSTRVTFRPDPESRDAADVDEVIRRMLTYGRTALVVHDSMLYATAGTIVPAYKRAVILGRSIGVPVWSLVQRPTGVHNVLLSELTHLLVWGLQLDSDRMKLAGIAGPDVLIPPDRPFAFGYYGPTTGGRLVRCDPMEVPGDPTDDRQSRARDDHGDGGNLRHQSPDPDRLDPGPVRPSRRHLAAPVPSPVRPAAGRGPAR